MPARPTSPPEPPPAIGAMSGSELKLIGERLFGTRGWQKGLGQALDLDVSTVRRYVDMERVPTVVAAALRHLERLQQASATGAAAHSGRDVPAGGTGGTSSPGRGAGR